MPFIPDDEQTVEATKKPTSGFIPDEEQNPIVRAYEQSSPAEQDALVTLLDDQVEEKRGTLQKLSDISDATFGRAANFMFGNYGKAVGGLITGGLASGAKLAGKRTILGADVDKLQKQADEAVTPGAIAGTVLESTAAGVGEKTVAKIGAKLTKPLVNRAIKIYESALKPSKSLLKRAPDVAKTGLEEGVRVSKGGLDKVVGIIEDIGDDIGKIIDQGAAQGRKISSKKLLPYLDEMKEFLGNVIGGDEMIKEVDELGKRFVSSLEKEIPIERAQELKRATQQFVKKYYNREAPLKFEVQKQLARGVKEEIANEVPEIATLNARDKKLIGLEEALAESLTRAGKREIINFGDLVTAGIGLLSQNNPVAKGGGLLIFKKILQNPTVKSQFAIYLNKLGKNAEKLIKAGRYPAAIAASKILQLFGEDNENDQESILNDEKIQSK